MHSPLNFSIIGVAIVVALTSSALPANERIDFSEAIAPLLEEHCIRCHMPGNEKGDISLATSKDLVDNEYITPGQPDASYLIDLITSSDGAPPAMPKEGAPLTTEQLELIRRWIQDGAVWPEDVVLRERSKADKSWWSLQSLATATPPEVKEAAEVWKHHPIDRFVFAKMQEKGLTPSAPADRRTLIRRATYDLIGLPPTVEEVHAFVNDEAPDAYEKLIDRLLASPHYGERWGRHWLDVVRFGESNGFERNVIINDLWPFRDYVITSLNEDKPFDQFIREHLAGDVFGKDIPDQEIGSAFLVAGPYDNVGNQDAVQAAQIRANTIDEMIRATSEAFLGLTIGCARCHDHKFDPILQKDYYALYATFAGVSHGSRIVASQAAREEHAAKVTPLRQQQAELTKQRNDLNAALTKQAQERLAEYQNQWQRPPISRLGTDETFEPVTAKFVKLVSEGQDTSPANMKSFTIDELEIWSSEDPPRNVALASSGATATGPSRKIQDFAGAYGPQKAIDGKTGERFIATDGWLQVELPQPTSIERIVMSSAKGETKPDQRKFVFLSEYRIEASMDGKSWTEIANSHDRKPVNDAHRDYRLKKFETDDEARKQLAEINRQLDAVNKQLAGIPPLPTVWVGNHDVNAAKGPFHTFIGGSPQRKGEEVVPASLSTLSLVAPEYKLDEAPSEAGRRQALADWIVDDNNPLTPRVLANRLWHYHFGTGIVDTPSDFGYMGSRPTHPELLDWLAVQLQKNNWRLKPLHKQIMLSQTYRQSSEYREAPARVDADSRFLWRYPPHRLSAEAIRDTILSVAGKLDTTMGGPGFRLYEYQQDNVATYVPLDRHGPETYRRAVYHQNARASIVDLMTDFDQPDCAFSTPRRAETTTPLQALTMLNHQFTLEMANAMAERLRSEAGTEPEKQIQRAYLLCYNRLPTENEMTLCQQLIEEHDLRALCRAILNTSEMIYVE